MTTPAPAAPTVAPALTGLRKAAIVLIGLGADASAAIMKQLTDGEVRDLMVEISRVRTLGPEVVQQVSQELMALAEAHASLLEGGVDYAREVLKRAVGARRAEEVLTHLDTMLRPRLFESVRQVDPKQLAELLNRESAQTVAIVLANLDPEMGPAVLGYLTPELQTEVVFRVATMDATTPDVVRRIDDVMARRLGAVAGRETTAAGGARAAAELLNRVPRSTSKRLLEELGGRDAPLTETIRAQMFTFEDITDLDDRAIQTVLKGLDQKELAIALKAAGEQVRDKIGKNLSERARQMLQQELEFLGPVRLRDVEQAQGAIVHRLRELEEAGELVLPTRGESDVFV